MFVLAGEKPATAKESARTVLRMETALAKGLMDNVRRRDPQALNNVRSLAQLKQSAPSFDWASYLQAIGAPTPKHYPVATPEFLAAMEQLIQQASLPEWRTYLRWWTLHGQAALLPGAFVDENWDFFAHTLQGSKKLLPRWRRCVFVADRDLGEALGAAYVQRAFPPESKKRVDQMVTDLRAALSAELKTLAWMTPATRKAAQEKLEAILQQDRLPGHLARLPGSRPSIGRTACKRRSASALRAPPAAGQDRQASRIASSGCMTPPDGERVLLPRSTTSSSRPASSSRRSSTRRTDDAVNFGAIGMVIGHEMTHGFDDEGRQFDASGQPPRLVESSRTRKAYEERSQCIVDQYTHDVPEPGVKLNGKLTQGEDIADNGGIRLAYAALDRALAKAGTSPTAKGPDGLTARQRFYAGNAFSWCQNIRPEFARVIIRTNPHSLHEYRVNDVVANQPEFREAFSCPAGKPMVRANACRVW